MRPSCFMQRVAAAVVMLAGASATARGQARPDADSPSESQSTANETAEAIAAMPWAEGVPYEVQVKARDLFMEGNVLLRDTLFARAAKKYEAALKLWDHPAFHYNLALARIHLDQPIAAYESLEQAVRYGPEPLNGQDRYDHGLRYLELLRNQLAHVDVACDEPGARVTLDGKPLFTGPGRHQSLVLPGGHQLLASAPGRIPATEQLVLAPGQRASVRLVLQRPVRTVTVRYMPSWIPWASLGLGAAVPAPIAIGLDASAPVARVLVRRGQDPDRAPARERAPLADLRGQLPRWKPCTCAAARSNYTCCCNVASSALGCDKTGASTLRTGSSRVSKSGRKASAGSAVSCRNTSSSLNRRTW